MQIKHATVAQPKVKNVYRIYINTYRGDADGDSNITLTVKPEKIQQVVAEIIFIKSQFSGRGGCSEMYDQSNYFGMTEEAWVANNDQHDGYWEWFDREMGDYPYYPYDGDHEQNYTLESYELFWFDENGAKIACTVHDTADLQTAIGVLNSKHKLGDYKVWDIDDASHLYEAYRADAIELLKKHTV